MAYTEPNYEDWLVEIDKQLLAWASGASISSYSIAGRTFTKNNTDALIAFREYVYGLYRRKTYGNVTVADMSGVSEEMQ